MKNFKLSQDAYYIYYSDTFDEYLLKDIKIYAFVTINNIDYIQIGEELNNDNLAPMSRCFDNIENALMYKNKCNYMLNEDKIESKFNSQNQI